MALSRNALLAGVTVVMVLLVALRPTAFSVDTITAGSEPAGTTTSRKPAATERTASRRPPIAAVANHIESVVESQPEDADGGHSGGGSAADAVAKCREASLTANASLRFSALQLCFDEARCALTMRVTARGCSRVGGSDFAFAPPTGALSRNETHAAWIRRSVGPVTLRWRLVGPEVHAASAATAFDGACTYTVAPPLLTRSGRYNVAVEWLYDGYAALDEMQNVWPRMRKVPLLPIPDPLPATNYHRQQLTPESASEFVVCRLPEAAEARLRDAEAQRPLCTGREAALSGRWVRKPAGSPSVRTRVRVRKLTRNPIRFLWALQAEPDHVWQPEACRRREGLTPAGVVRALKAARRTRIVVGGDSQLRALYFGLVNFLGGHDLACVRDIPTVDSEPPQCVANVKGSHRKNLHGIDVDFVDDLFLDRLGSGRYGGYGVVIAGFGQHPASKEHWSLDRYRAAVAARAGAVRALQKAGALVVWTLAPQYPHTTSGYPVVVRDWRTDPRLRMFNNHSADVMRALGAPVVDSFAISTPFGHTSPDQAHFSNFVLSDIIAMLLNSVCAACDSTCSE